MIVRKCWKKFEDENEIAPKGNKNNIKKILEGKYEKGRSRVIQWIISRDRHLVCQAVPNFSDRYLYSLSM
ncbi:hypothetical protein V1477_014740 [Vespula maculifrons]|uniref:Uncharacterized protein n=1 Tax=Vespula maculifrons TaxID=7453 RepID=A0ABD2BIC7_VESMC